MKSLLKMELFKWRKSKSFVVCSIIAVGLMIFVIGTFAALGAVLEMAEEEMTAEFEAQKPGMIQEYVDSGMSREEAEMTVEAEIADAKMMLSVELIQTDGQNLFICSAYQSSVHILIAIFVALFTAAEFSSGTMKIMVASGKGRTKIYFAKLLVVSLAATIMMLIPMLIGLAGGSAIWGFYPESGAIAAKTVTLLILVQFVLNLAITSMFMAISVIFRSLGAAIALNIAIFQFSSIIFALADALYDYILNVLEIEETKVVPSSLWIINAFMNSSTPVNFKMDVFTRNMIVGVVYFAIFTLIGLQAFRKRDIK
ncbi:MAG: ABC transporter permease subunit [Lachnospiraceae bacterium]|nr:ABC transporter permease subunit [Lachnospiraceae bacterium]